MKHPILWPLSTVAALVAGGCADTPTTQLRVPTAVTAVAPPSYVERAPTGSLFQPNAPIATMFSGEKRPRSIGDTLKVEINETLSANQKVATDTSRENKIATKGPGTDSENVRGALKSLLNLDAEASGSDSFVGKGTTENSNKFTGRIAASVINVLPNGHLVVAGERSIAYNEGVTTLRFSGVVNPDDIKAGNVVASSDIVDARLEAVGRGGVADTASRSWMQRFLSKGLAIW
jgi:flagellar L-ring protein precursor FlgH